MTKKTKIVILLLITTLLFFATVKQSIKFHNSTKKINIPTEKNRRLSKLGVYNWMTVSELSKKFNIKEEKIFDILGISPDPQDNTLNIKALKEKHNKSSEEILKALESIIEYGTQSGGIHE